MFLSQWFPDVVVTIFRGVSAGFCLGWIIYSGFHPANGEEKWFIFLTNWGFTFLTLYFIWATVVGVVHHLGGANVNHQFTGMQMKGVESDGNHVEGGNVQPVENMSWYHKGLWVIFNIASNTAILITLLYWTLIFGGKTSGLDITTHLINSVLIVVDVMLSTIPVRILHVVYPWMLGFSYALLTVIFWAAKGSNARNQPYIYSYIDYNKTPAMSSGIIVGFLLVGQPLIQAIVFGLYKLRGFLSLKCSKQ